MLRVAALALLAGCSAFSSTATIYRYRQPTYEATIVDGDATAIVLEDHQGGRHRVERRGITSIDHPGNVLAGFGVAFGVIGGVLAYDATFDHDPEREDRQDRYMAAGFYGVVGLVMLVAGGRAWWRSTEAVNRGAP